MGADVEGSEPPLRLRRRRRNQKNNTPNRKLQPADDLDLVRDRRERTLTRLELIVDERFSAAMRREHPGMVERREPAEPKRRKRA